MNKSSSSFIKKNSQDHKTMIVLPVFFIALLTMFTMPISMQPQVAMAFDDDIDIDLDKSIPGFRDCNKGDPNCIDNQIVNLQNQNPSSREDAKIDLSLVQALNCDGNPDCPFQVLNTGFQGTALRSLDDSFVDADVEMDMSQKIDGENQDNFIMINDGRQTFEIFASGESKVDADNRGDNVEMEMSQKNSRCDDSGCLNQASQSYFIAAADESFIDMRSNQGFDSYQINKGCDNGVGCINNAQQRIELFASDDSELKFDTRGLNDVKQVNNCDDGDFNCQNSLGIGDTPIGQIATVTTSGHAEVDVDDLIQDSYQSNNCDQMGGQGCLNEISAIAFSVSASDYAEIDAEASQEISQSNRCEGGVCTNQGSIQAQLIAEDNSYINSDSSQNIDQSNECTNSLCANLANALYVVHTTEGATVYSDVNQDTTQSNECTNEALCTNISNQVYSIIGADESFTAINGDQTTNQSCNANAGSCLSTVNSVATVTSTENSFAILDTTQNFDSNDSGQGEIHAIFDNGDFGFFSETQTETGMINIEP